MTSQSFSTSTISIHYFSALFLQIPIYIFTFLLFKIFCRIKCEGQENLLGKTQFIFAPNHSSEWDGPLVRVGLPFFWKGSPMYYVSMRKELYTDSGWRKAIYGGTLFHLLGACPIYSGQKDYSFSLQNFLTILKRGRSVCIFPEGQRTRTGEYGQAHGGVAYLAVVSGVPIVPVAISGLVDLTLADLFLRKRQVVIRYGMPIQIEKKDIHSVEDYKKKAEEVMSVVKNLSKKC